jgi:hypothetical protein
MTQGDHQPMRGKTVLVTGATSGIGRATALGLAAMGAQSSSPTCSRRASGCRSTCTSSITPMRPCWSRRTNVVGRGHETLSHW